MQKTLLHAAIFIFCFVSLVFGFLAVMSKPKIIDTDIRDFANKCREYVFRQEQREFPKRGFDIHMQVKEKELW